jgi:hypothetical protein
MPKRWPMIIQHVEDHNHNVARKAQTGSLFQVTPVLLGDHNPIYHQREPWYIGL